MKTTFNCTIKGHESIVEPIEAMLNMYDRNDGVQLRVLEELKSMYRNFCGTVSMTDDGRTVRYFIDLVICENGKVVTRRTEIGNALVIY